MSKYPENVKHDDFLTAIKPLLDLCGSNAEEMFFPLRLVEGDLSNREQIELARIEFLTAVDPGDGTEPVSVGEGEFAQLGWPVSVVVI